MPTSPVGSDAGGENQPWDAAVELTAGRESRHEPEASRSSMRLHKFLASKPKRWQRRLIRRPWLLPVVAMQLSAMRIQRAWRSSWLRSAKPTSALGTRAPPTSPNPYEHSRQQPARWRTKVQRSAAADVLRQRHLDHLRTSAENPGAVAGRMVYQTYQIFCLALLQGWWRSKLVLRRVKRVRGYQLLKLHNVAAFEIQRAWRVYHQRSRSPSEDDMDVRLLLSLGTDGVEELDLIRHAKMLASAARKIQHAWRGIQDYRVYETLRDTIGSCRRSGDPYLLLRAVLPRESMLLDPAMQIHARFRLGGTRFPPSIYYKIYTHGNIVDLCSFAPRNYHAAREGNNDAAWYQRVECNGWRPLNARITKTNARVMDEVEKDTSRKRIPNFHHSKLRRRQDVERRRKIKGVEWMRKLYGFDHSDIWQASASLEPDSHREDYVNVLAAGGGFAAGAPSALGGAVRLASSSPSSPSVASAAALAPRPPPGPPPARPNRQRPGSAASHISESEASLPLRRVLTESPSKELQRAAEDNLAGEFSDDMLLDWSRKLNFDSYMQDWQTTATTDGSEGTLPIASKFATGLVY
eukprot:TRINITY_DN33629_c0_g1_i1.p1 TRINITY_DN33629_c0_g1~~TRINITY_DN33629_c0_g1_i1.p1  ORF type:complete len:579 (+),score=84.49 TRINITY_DN33629_c0_g1_i1:70-1806(+)